MKIRKKKIDKLIVKNVVPVTLLLYVLQNMVTLDDMASISMYKLLWRAWRNNKDAPLSIQIFILAYH